MSVSQYNEPAYGLPFRSYSVEQMMERDLDEVVNMHVNTVTNISPTSSKPAGRDNGLSRYPHPYWCI